MPDANLPNPLHVVSTWIKSRNTVAGNRVSPRLGTVMPAVRLANVGPRERGPEEHLDRVQVECWADDDDDASDLARTIEAGLPHLLGVYATDGAVCAGAAVVVGPFAAPDESSQRYRYLLDVELWLYPYITS